MIDQRGRAVTDAEAGPQAAFPSAASVIQILH